MSVRVIGAGLSGLAAALHLAEAGLEVEVIEASDRPGGLIETRATPFGPVEMGANAFVWDAAAGRLFDQIGIAPRFAAVAALRRRFIFRDGRARRWPLRPLETATMALHRASAAAFGRSRPHAHESVADWSARVHGRAAARWLVSPALQGTYGAPADRLAAQAIRSLGASRPSGRRTALRLAAPPGGMTDLVQHLVAHLQQRGVRFSFGRAMATLDPRVPTVVATSARAAARLVAPHAPWLGAALDAVPHVGLSLTAAFFEPRRDDRRGFGVLFPRGCGVRSLGVRFDSELFPYGEWRVETWIGEEDDSLSDEQLCDAVWADRRRLTGRLDDPRHVVTVRRPAALPLYNASIVEVRRRLSALPPWLALAGNYLGRLGVSALLDTAADAGRRIARYNFGTTPAVPAAGAPSTRERRAMFETQRGHASETWR